MGRVWAEVRCQLRKVLASEAASSEASNRRPPRRAPAPVLHGPDACSLVTADEIEAATGQRPRGPGDAKSGGMQTDLGLFKVC